MKNVLYLRLKRKKPKQLLKVINKEEKEIESGYKF